MPTRMTFSDKRSPMKRLISAFAGVHSTSQRAAVLATKPHVFKKKKFERKVVMKELSSEEQEKFEKNQEEYNMFLTGSKYKLIYNFPKKIKNVNFPDAQFSANRKTLIIEVDMDSLLKNPQLLDLKVTF